MSETHAATTALPLFYKRVVGINPALHGQLKLDRTTGFGFSAAAQSVPLGLSEFEAAAQHYPVLFAAGATPVPVVLLGLRDHQNLFVLPNGQWRPDTYVPAYVRAFPFIFLEDEKTKTLHVGMEPDADCLSLDSGLPLFEDGRPTATLNQAVAFCTAYREGMVAATTFARALEAAGLLEEEEANINFTAGGGARIRGFKMVKPERLIDVDDATFLEWRRLGWIAAIYAHIYSAGRWAKLIELGAPPRPTAH